MFTHFACGVFFFSNYFYHYIYHFHSLFAVSVSRMGLLLNSARAVIVVLVVTLGNGYMPHLTPFFFLCNYHGNVQEFGLQSGEVAIKVSIVGNPEFYTPGQFYEGKIASSLLSFHQTGSYSLTLWAVHLTIISMLP